MTDLSWVSTYQDFYVAETWEFTEPMAVKVIYKQNTEKGYASNHKIIVPDKYIFIYTMEGAGSFIVDDTQLMVGANSLVVINAKQSLHYHCAGPKWNFWLFEFKTPNQLFTPNKVYPLTLGKSELRLCVAALRDLKLERLHSAGALFQALYYAAYRKIQEGPNAKRQAVLRSATQYMRENLSHFSVADLCAYLNIEERTLRNIFVQNLNTPPKQYFEFLRLEEAKRYLETTALSIAAIASQLGFSNPGHFSTAFRKEYGVTPKSYRMTFSASVEPTKW